VAQEIFIEMMETGKTASVIIKAKGLEQIGSEEELEKIVLAVIEQNPDSVAKYRGGNERLLAFFVGQSMKETKGKGNPMVIQQLLKKHLG
jgi:aspartyl-tRNA(Asn)/glutamyl-tRNA(Gln) amidotransferase subunit B